MKKILNVFLAFAIIFSTIFQSSGIASAVEYPNNVITSARITDLSDQAITGNNIGAWIPFRVHATYALPNNTLHNGDKTILTLPVGFAAASPFTFDVKDGNEVVAKGKLIDGSPVKLELTYTNYVDTHSGVSGTFFFNLQINSHTQPNTGDIPVTLTAKDGQVTNAGTVPFNPPTVAPQHLLKGGWMDSNDKSIGHYKISVNQENKAMVGATLVDELKTPGVKYDKGSFTVSEVKWVVNPTQTDIIATEEVDVTSQFQSSMNIEDTRFTIAIGSRPAGKGLLVRYKTKISYQPVVGEKFKNSVELADNGQVTNRDLTYKILGAGGSSAGYVYKIKIKKTNENGAPLSGAKFSVIRDRNGIVAGTITSGTDGTGELGNLVKDKYKLVETEAPQGYAKLTNPTIVEESEFDGSDRTALKTIKNKPETVDVSVTKAWVGPAKTSAKVVLKKAGNPAVIEEKELTAGGGWTTTFTGKPKYEANGTEIKYTVEEKDVPQGYTASVSGTMASGFTITNTNTEKVNVSVTKAWVGPAKASAKVELRKEGSNNALQTQELNAAGSWKHTFTGLDKYENNGTPIKYTVVEKDVPQGYTASVSGTMASGFTITNTNTEKVNVSVTKAWVGPAKTSAKVVLKKVGNPAVIEEKELTAGGGWTTTFTGKPKYEANGTEIKYTVEEKDVPQGYTASVSGTMASGFTITNTNTEKVNVSVTKAWVGPKKASAKVVLKKVGNPAVIEEKELNEAGSWRATFTGRPKYEANGTEIKYTVEEKDVPQGYTASVSGTMASGFTITNTNTEKVNVSVTKAWVGPKKASAKVVLKKVGNPAVIEEKELTAGGGWTTTFTGKPKYEANGTEIKYTVEEKDVPQGYTASVSGTMASGFTITNTNTEKVNVSVTKAWVGPKKASAKVVLKKVGNPAVIEEKELNEAGSWRATFTGRPKYEANGTEIKYTVEEKDVPQGYTASVSGTMASGFTITNTNTEKVNVSVTKAWVGPKKASAKVVLKKVGNPAVIEEKELNEAGSWRATFTGRPKYEANGTEIKYTVEEKDVPQGYTANVSGTMASGFTITNTNTEKVNVSVTKAWVGPAKTSAKVVLKKVGNPAVIEEKELTAGGGWTTTFTGKPKYEANGTEIKYTVEEKDVPQGYTASVSGTMASGFTITNTNTEKVNVSVEKKWIGSLKGSVVAQLKKEGSATVIQEKELNAAGLWKHTFTGLAKYEANGTLIKYEVVEKTVPQGYVVSYEKDPAGVLIIKNKQTKIDVKVTKKWKNVTGNNPKIKVQLLKNGQNEGAPIELPNGTTTHTWTNLDKANPQGNDYVYSVKEVGETANAIQLEGDQYKVTYEGNMKDGLTITNEKKPYNPGGGGGGGTPTPDPGVIGGGDRIETAIKISRRFYDKAKTVIVVRHDLFPDSMTASVLAKLKDAPILLNPTDKLDPRVGAEIKRLGAEEVIIVGGPDSVSERVREELKVYDKDKNVERVAGVDRYGTSEMVARRVTGITGKKYTGVVASGQVFPDALSVGTFASREAYPILLVKKDTVPYQIERAIKDLDISKTYIAGGTSTIFKSTEAKLPGVLERMAGKDRYETSVAIAKSKFKDSKEAFIASGEEFADALVISPISGKYNKPTLLASRNKNTNAVVKKYIQDAGLTSIIAIGGEKYLPYSVLLNLVGK